MCCPVQHSAPLALCNRENVEQAFFSLIEDKTRPSSADCASNKPFCVATWSLESWREVKGRSRCDSNRAFKLPLVLAGTLFLFLFFLLFVNLNHRDKLM